MKWLVAPETGNHFAEQIGPFLSAVEQNITLLDDEVVASLDYFLSMQENEARTELQRHFATHQPTSVGVQNLLKRHGLVDVETSIPTFGATTTGISTTTTTTTAGNRKRFDHEDANAQVALGDCYWNGEGVSVDRATAFESYRKAAHRGLVEAEVALGNFYWNGTGVKENKAQAFAWYRKAADQGCIQANVFLN